MQIGEYLSIPPSLVCINPQARYQYLKVKYMYENERAVLPEKPALYVHLNSLVHNAVSTSTTRHEIDERVLANSGTEHT
jgi:hypothetical protein